MIFIVMVSVGCSAGGEGPDPWVVLQKVALARDQTMSVLEQGPRDEVVVAVVAEKHPTVRVMVWPPDSEGPSFVKVGALRLTFERIEKVGVTPQEVQDAVLLVQEGLEQAGCSERGVECFQALKMRVAGGDSSDSAPSPIRPFLLIFWLAAIAVAPMNRGRGPQGRMGLKSWGGVLICVLLTLFVAWTKGVHGFLVENFRAGTVMQEALRSGYTSVHGDSIYALFGVALTWGGLDEAWLFGVNVLCSGLAVWVLGVLLIRLGLAMPAVVGACLLLGFHPLWIRHAATEAMVVPNALLWLLMVSRVLTMPGLYGPAERSPRWRDALLDCVVLVLVLGGRPELVVITFATVLCGAWLTTRAGHGSRALVLITALGFACAAHYPRFAILLDAARGEYLGERSVYGLEAFGNFTVHWHVGAPALFLCAMLAAFMKPSGPGLRRLGLVAWVVGVLAHLHIVEGEMSGSQLRLATQQLAPLALLASGGIHWAWTRLRPRFNAVGMCFAAVALVALCAGQLVFAWQVVHPRALETEQGRVARALLCGYDGPPLRFVAMPRRSDGVGVLLPATSNHLVEACFPDNPSFLSLEDVVERRIRLREGERGLIWLDATCDLEVLNDDGVFEAQPVAALCDQIETAFPLIRLDARVMEGEIIKPSRRPRGGDGLIRSRLYVLEGPWPSQDTPSP